MALVVDESQIGAHDGPIDLDLLGGYEPFEFQWSSPTDPNFRANSPSINHLRPGIYCVTVTDGLCGTAVLCGEVKPGINLTGNVSPTCLSTNVGSIDLSVSNANYPVTYDWSNDGPDNPDNDSEDIGNLAAGSYSVTVTDDQGRTATRNFQVTSTSILAGIRFVRHCTNFSTNNGEISAVATGSDGPFNFTWSNGISTNNVYGSTITQLSSGTYWVTISNQVGCSQVITTSVY